jgi:predicted GIY-YIG superfamily endonuclease
MWLDDHRTALYRFFDEGGALLYVGITAHVEARWLDHERTKPWWPQVATRTVEWFDTRPPALAAENRAVKEERPVYNVNGTGWDVTRRPLTPEERTPGQIQANLLEYCGRAQHAGEVVFAVDTTRKRRRTAALVSVAFYRQALEDRARLEGLEK